MKKGAALLGIGIDNVRLVPCDSRGRMDVEALDRLTEQAKDEVRLIFYECFSLLIFTFTFTAPSCKKVQRPYA